MFVAVSILLAPQSELLDEITSLKVSDEDTTRIYLIRHGESVFNAPDANGMKYTSGKSLAIPLTEKGLKQASKLGEILVNKFPKDSSLAILSSTAIRAQQTADRIFEGLKEHYPAIRGINAYENLCEVAQGDWDGKPKDALFNQVIEPWERLSAKDKFTIPKFEKGESFQDGASRFLLGLQEAIDQHPNKTLLIIAHCGAMSALALQLNPHFEQLSEQPGTPMPTIPFSNCDLLMLELPKSASVDQAKIEGFIKSGI